jgi:thiol:disulfide interchange protein DsbD
MRPPRLLLTALLLATGPRISQAQLEAGGSPPPPDQLVRVTSDSVHVSAGHSARATVRLTIQHGWHVNSNPPSPNYMIPTRLEMTSSSGVVPGKPRYPSPRTLKVEFDEQPLSVYDSTAVITVPITAAADAVNGHLTLHGKLSFQSCNDQVCLAPARVPVAIEVLVSGGTAPVASAVGHDSSQALTDTLSAATPELETHDTTAFAPGRVMPVGGAVASNPIADALNRGGLFAIFTLFLVGLALNLTPCVYPMLGVTVSIFGARSAAPTAKVFGSALVYVLGITAMYSALGVAAALTGGLFGSFLQSPFVLLGIGVLLVLMSLSMFGFYELQPPAWMMTKLGGAGNTGLAGLFLSGLLVGVFAAPCVGPPVVALLAIVGAKADPWFGFVTFFTLALGLGAPYLVLGTFSNLIQKLPRSGDWMVWVKKVFGVVLASIGLFYGLIAFAPALAFWVAPVALIAGGVYLGFLESSAAKRRGFLVLKRALGVAGLVCGVWLVIMVQRQGITFRDYDPTLVKQALASGKSVMLDFSADWCIPCHELERVTFTDRRVIAAARSFEAFRVDLTHSDQPEVQQHVRDFKIRGVPTIVFLATDGREVAPARFSGFLPPERFLERMKMVTSGSPEVGGATPEHRPAEAPTAAPGRSG